MTPERFAEEFEKARYESMLSRRWDELRDTERAARTAAALAALRTTGLLAVLEESDETALRAEVFSGLLAQRDAEIARIRAEHAAQLTALQARHEADLTAHLSTLQARHEADLTALEERHTAELMADRDDAEASVRSAVAVA